MQWWKHTKSEDTSTEESILWGVFKKGKKEATKFKLVAYGICKSINFLNLMSPRTLKKSLFLQE
jgi:hypothetical protein